jgi:riboflavin kinase/FMN adenylyltransferase
MRHYRSLNEVSLQHSRLTIGVFDGVHRGHQEIIKLVAAASPSVVMTFTPHPANVLSGHDIKCLTTPDERAELLAALGVDVVITEPFTRDLAAVSAYEFMSRLKQHIGLEYLLIGYDFALGRGREGNAARLTEIGRELGFTVEVVPAVGDDSGVISSTEIRKLVSLGDISAATELLGHPYQISGTVIHGDHRGRTIGFPTANIDYPTRKVLPSNGIYSCWAWLGNERIPAAVNVGLRPTVKDNQAVPNVEAYLLDFDRDIYGQHLRLDFVARLRDELKFDSLDALIAQMHDDVRKTRQILESNVS